MKVEIKNLCEMPINSDSVSKFSKFRKAWHKNKYFFEDTYSNLHGYMSDLKYSEPLKTSIH